MKINLSYIYIFNFDLFFWSDAEEIAKDETFRKCPQCQSRPVIPTVAHLVTCI